MDELIINHRIKEEVRSDSDSADFPYLSQVCPNDPGQLLSFELFLLCPSQRLCICGIYWICTQTHPEQDPYLINTLIPASPVHFTAYLGYSEALYTLGLQNEGSHLLPSFHADFSTSGGP